MAVHAVGINAFELWRGDPPRFHQQSVEVFSRTAVEGTAAKIKGKRGESFTAELESWFTSYAAARAQFVKYLNLIGASAQKVTYNNQQYWVLHKTRYLVLDVKEVDCRTNVRLIGPGINYAGGAALITRWTMIPIRDTE
jgi:hypothetical protein